MTASGGRRPAEGSAGVSTRRRGTPLETLLEKRQHIAVVVGKYGETKGLVTLEDVLETLLGIEILDDGDKIEDMQQLARQLWARHANGWASWSRAPESISSAPGADYSFRTFRALGYRLIKAEP